MAKISIDARVINNSGVGTYLQNLILNLIKNHELILLGNKKEILRFPWAERTKIINFNSPIYSISEQLLAPFKIPKSEIHLTPFYNIPILPIKAKKRLVIIHDVYHLAFNSSLSPLQRLYSKFMFYSAVNLSDHIITISEFSKSEILKYEKIDEKKISIVYFGFSFKEYSGSALSYEQLKKKYEMNEKYILFVSNVKPHKNLYNLLQALDIILKKNIKLKLIVAGEYKNLITVDNRSVELLNNNPMLKRNVTFTGYVEKDELVSLYKNASCFVFPSLYEGFGIPPLEAMAYGCPVIASNKASIPEVCGNSVLYINPDDINDIVEKISTIISNPNIAAKLIAKGKENIKRFSEEAFANNLNKVIDSLI